MFPQNLGVFLSAYQQSYAKGHGIKRAVDVSAAAVAAADLLCNLELFREFQIHH